MNNQCEYVDIDHSKCGDFPCIADPAGLMHPVTVTRCESRAADGKRMCEEHARKYDDFLVLAQANRSTDELK